MSTITKQVLAIPAALAASLLLLGACASKADTCQTPEGLTLQILGSGGPVADDARSSTSYVIWADGQSRVLVDFGSGAFLRFGQAGARFEDIDHIAISHFHTDHSADLVALLKTGYFSDRRRDLSISGPSGSGLFPGLDRFLDRLVGKDGAYAYLSGYMDGSGGLPLLRPVTLDATARKAMPVFGDDESPLQIEAIGVPHSIVPALAYRIRIDDKIIVFSGDQNGNDDAFTRFARNADVLVMHMPVPEGVRGGGRQLHAPPSRIGQIANRTTAQTLVISHFMARSLQDIDANIDIIRGHFDGEIIRASDLQCIDINSHGK